MFAIIRTGGKQYQVKENQTIKIEKIVRENAQDIHFDEVLMLASDDGSQIEVGTPLIIGKSVSAKILRQGRAKKIRVVKFKPKVRYQKVYGHRQPFTEIQITKIPSI